MLLSDFDYDLPEALIAQAPLAERVPRACCWSTRGSRISAIGSSPISVDLVDPGDLLVFNDTRVIPARLFGRKSTGGKVEVMVERVLDDNRLLAHLRASKAPKAGAELILENEIECRMLGREQDLFVLGRSRAPGWSCSNATAICRCRPISSAAMRAPIESAIKPFTRVTRARLRRRPRACISIPRCSKALQQRGVASARLTLHVGAGTFQPVRGDDIDSHVMHPERIEVTQSVVDSIAQTRARGGRVIAVGTTVVRSLETAAAEGELAAFDGDSRLFIKPGYRFRVVDAMLTNFHLPKSTLLMLVSAFAGSGLMRRAYAHAVAQRYRFFSYGDAMFIANRAGQELS